MKKIFALFYALLLCGAVAWGQEYSSGVKVSNLELLLDGEELVLVMDLDFSAMEPSATETEKFSLAVVSGVNYVTFPVATLLGRTWFFHHARERRSDQPFQAADHTWYYKDAPTPYRFVARTLYREWMADARMRIDVEKGGCCGKPGKMSPGKPIKSAVFPVPEPEPEKPVFKPEYIYVLPPAETTVKQRDVSGEAYVVFASGKTAVDSEFSNNAAELEKIHATIDSVKADPDVTITSVVLRGYSSPEGSYATNQKLSAARTQAIKDYVCSLDSLSEDIIVAESVAENWDALRVAVEESDMVSREKILAIIDSDAAPDKKEARIKANYPSQWKYLLKEVFPLLRRTDYKVSYTVKSYTTTEDARRIMHVSPDKLSITEFFLAAQGYSMGTWEFDQVFAIAARVYPDNDVVNINAANAAMSLGNLEAARRYLQRAGDGAVAHYTKGVLCALEEDWDGAVMFFSSAKASGVPEADAALESALQMRDYAVTQ